MAATATAPRTGSRGAPGHAHAGPDAVAVGQRQRHRDQPDSEADHDRHRQHLVALGGGGGAGEPVRELLALVRGSDQDGGPRRRRRPVGHERQAPGVEGEQHYERDRERAGAATRKREEQRQAEDRQGRRGERPADGVARAGCERQQQRDADRGEGPEAVPAIERVVQAGLRPGEEGGRLEVGEPGRMEAREHSDRRDEHDAGGNAAHHPSQAVSILDRERQDEDTHEGRDPSDLGHAALGALRPGDPERGPRRERRQQTDGNPGAAAKPCDGQGADRGAEQDDPPHGNADLTADDGVVASVTQTQVGDQQERQPGLGQPGSGVAQSRQCRGAEIRRPLGRELGGATSTRIHRH